MGEYFPYSVQKLSQMELEGYAPSTSVCKTSALSQTELHSNNKLFSSQGCHPKMLLPHLSLAFCPQQDFYISNLAACH